LLLFRLNERITNSIPKTINTTQTVKYEYLSISLPRLKTVTISNQRNNRYNYTNHHHCPTLFRSNIIIPNILLHSITSITHLFEVTRSTTPPLTTRILHFCYTIRYGGNKAESPPRLFSLIVICDIVQSKISNTFFCKPVI